MAESSKSFITWHYLQDGIRSDDFIIRQDPQDFQRLQDFHQDDERRQIQDGIRSKSFITGQRQDLQDGSPWPKAPRLPSAPMISSSGRIRKTSNGCKTASAPMISSSGRIRKTAIGSKIASSPHR